MEDWRKAPVTEKIRSTLGFIEKLTLKAGEIIKEDLEPLRNAGVSERAMEDAIHVVVLFSIIDRIADSLDFDIPSSSGFGRLGAVLLKRGYK